MGDEEERDHRARAAPLRAEGIDVVGPLPADTMFHARARAGYDVALCMYHDQALMPVKTLDFDEAVNVTLGLPFVRTSPDHGTALDIAGQGVARPDSLVAAIEMAAAIARWRARRQGARTHDDVARTLAAGPQPRPRRDLAQRARRRRIPIRSASRISPSRPGPTGSPCICARTAATSATPTSSG